MGAAIKWAPNKKGPYFRKLPMCSCRRSWESRSAKDRIRVCEALLALHVYPVVKSSHDFLCQASVRVLR